MKKIISLLRLDERGMVLVTSLLLVSLLSLLGVTYTMQATTDLKISANYKTSRETFYAAEGAINYAVEVLNERLNVLNPNLNIPTPAAPTGIEFTVFQISGPGDEFQQEINSGPWQGLTAFIRGYPITVTASGENNAVATIEAVLEDRMIPLFQFGIFYEDDMEILPGANMEFTGTPRPRIHSNSEIYLNANGGRTLTLNARLSAANRDNIQDGGIHRGRKNNSDVTGTVRINSSTQDGVFDYQNMNSGFDSSHADWSQDSQTRWNGNVRTSEHGVNELNLPMPTEQPRDILGTGSESMHAKAGLKIINGTATDANGTVVDITYTNADGDVINPISTSTFYDQREQRTVTVTNIDMQALLESSAVNTLNNPPSGEDSGILYISDSDTVRLTNGDNLSAMGSTGLTVVTDRPLYVQGDYNTANAPSSIMADAITILSNDWNDVNSLTSGQELSLRTASNTTVNAALMTGNVATVGSQYSGGVENFPRFLENWSGKEFEYSGSLVCLWESEHATGNWVYGGRVYEAPTRNWSYAMDLNNLPPGTPRVRTMAVGAWLEAGMRD